MRRSILYVGLGDGTSLHREKALGELGHEVVHVHSDLPSSGVARQIYRLGHHLRWPPDLVGTNAALLKELRARQFDLLWVDKGITVRPRTLLRAKALQPSLLLVSYSPDDMFARDLQSVQYLKALPLYDLHVTTKSFNVTELPTLGAREVLFIDNAYDPETHRPLELSDEERRCYAAEVGFVGTYERERATAMLELARAQVPVMVHGAYWERFPEQHPNLVRRGPLHGLDYARAVNATRINLGFLRKAYRDLQTTRSIEIPACGGFLLAERTGEHQRLFEEGKEAEFFSSFDEMLEKIRYYLEHEAERERIAAAGLARCRRDDYSNQGRLAMVLAHLEERRGSAR